jgi:hypothetical protein
MLTAVRIRALEGNDRVEMMEGLQAWRYARNTICQQILSIHEVWLFNSNYESSYGIVRHWVSAVVGLTSN